MLTKPTEYISPALGKVRWKVSFQFQHNGQNVRLRKDGFLSASEASAWLEKQHAGIIHGFIEPPKKGSKPGRKLKVCEAASVTFQQVYEAFKDNIKGSIKPLTWKLWEAQFRNHILPVLGNHPFASLDGNAIKKALGNRPAGQKAITITCIRAIFRHAEQAGITLPVIPKATWKNKGATESRKTYLTSENVNDLKGLCSPALYPHIIFLIYTGMRIGEYRGLEWSDIDLKKRTISITKQRLEDGSIATTKNDKTRVIPLHPEAHAALTAIAAQKGATWKTSGFIMEIKTHQIMTETKRLGEAFEIDKLVIHSYRHTCASLMVQSNETAEKVAHILGDSVATVLKYYTHLDVDSVRNSIEALPRLTA